MLGFFAQHVGFFVDNEMLLKIDTLPEDAACCSTVVRGDANVEGDIKLRGR